MTSLTFIHPYHGYPPQTSQSPPSPLSRLSLTSHQARFLHPQHVHTHNRQPRNTASARTRPIRCKLSSHSDQSNSDNDNNNNNNNNSNNSNNNNSSHINRNKLHTTNKTRHMHNMNIMNTLHTWTANHRRSILVLLFAACFSCNLSIPNIHSNYHTENSLDASTSASSSSFSSSFSSSSSSPLWDRFLTGNVDVPVTFGPHPAHALSEDQKLVAEAWRVVYQSYLDRTFNNQDWFGVRMKNIKKNYASRQEAYQSIVKMYTSLNDPYTRFLTPEQFTSLTSTATGNVRGGIGVELYPARVDPDKNNRTANTSNNNNMDSSSTVIMVANVVDGGSASKNGVKSGDIIVEVDGEPLEPSMTPDEVAARIRGSPGTSVVLTLVRGTEPKEINIQCTREQLVLKSVSYEIKDNCSAGNDKIGYLKIKTFSQSTADDALEALQTLKRQGATRFVIDLRNNPGGYFPAGVDVARLFLPNNAKIVFVVNSDGSIEEYEVRREKGMHAPFEAEPLTILVNDATASASEVLTAALKDNNRATVVGDKTFGKGVVQTLLELSDGSGVAVTVSRYETPNHSNINKIGIQPDVLKNCPMETTDLCTCLPTK